MHRHDVTPMVSLHHRYGDYAKLTKLCTKSIDNKDKVLVIGCGESPCDVPSPQCVETDCFLCVHR